MKKFFSRCVVALSVVTMLMATACNDTKKQTDTSAKESTPVAKSMLETIKERGYVKCGVDGQINGFSMPNKDGKWEGIDVETARAVAVAVFGDPTKVKFSQLTAVQRFPALQNGEVDLLCRNTTQTLTRETSNGLNFAQVNFYDGQAFMVRKSLNVKSLKDLNGATVGVNPGTTTEMNAADYFRANNIKWKPVVIEGTAELYKAFFAGRCDVVTSDFSQLAAFRTTAKNPDDYMIIPQIISKEPLAPAVRHGDDQWYDIVNFSVMALINAEEMGITSANADELVNSSKDPSIKRFLGVTGDLGKALGLDNKWAYNIVKHVGNYGEVYERTVGPNTKLGLERGLNQLWNKGGIMYAPPFR